MAVDVTLDVALGDEDEDEDDEVGDPDKTACSTLGAGIPFTVSVVGFEQLGSPCESAPQQYQLFPT